MQTRDDRLLGNVWSRHAIEANQFYTFNNVAECSGDGLIGLWTMRICCDSAGRLEEVVQQRALVGFRWVSMGVIDQQSSSDTQSDISLLSTAGPLSSTTALQFT